MGHVAMRQKEQTKFGTQISHVPSFDYLREFLLTRYHFRKSGFGNLEEMVFGKPLGCTSKLCNRLPACLCLEKR